MSDSRDSDAEQTIQSTRNRSRVPKVVRSRNRSQKSNRSRRSVSAHPALPSPTAKLAKRSKQSNPSTSTAAKSKNNDGGPTRKGKETAGNAGDVSLRPSSVQFVPQLGEQPADDIDDLIDTHQFNDNLIHRPMMQSSAIGYDTPIFTSKEEMIATKEELAATIRVEQLEKENQKLRKTKDPSQPGPSRNVIEKVKEKNASSIIHEVPAEPYEVLVANFTIQIVRDQLSQEIAGRDPQIDLSLQAKVDKAVLFATSCLRDQIVQMKQIIDSVNKLNIAQAEVLAKPIILRNPQDDE